MLYETERDEMHERELELGEANVGYARPSASEECYLGVSSTAQRHIHYQV